MKVSTVPGRLFIFAVRAYQCWVSPLVGPSCRFSPTCSEYAVLAVKKYGAARGAVKAAGRVCRCHPLSAGGVDLP